MLPPNVQTTIDQIIAATEEVTPDLHQSLQDELSEQFEQLLHQVIIEQLPDDQVDVYEQLMATQPEANQAKIQQFLTTNIPNISTLIDQASSRLKDQYIE